MSTEHQRRAMLYVGRCIYAAHEAGDAMSTKAAERLQAVPKESRSWVAVVTSNCPKQASKVNPFWYTELQ